MTLKITPGTRLGPGVKARVPLPAVAYFVDSAVGIINEGDTMTFNVSTTAVPDGTVLYWKVENETTTDARFAAVSGSVTVTAGAGSFGVSPLADLQTEGTTLFHVTLRTGSVAGTVVWTTGNKAVGDTSLTPPVHGSGVFNQPQEDYLTITAPSYTAAGAGSGAYYGNQSQAPILKGDYPQPQPGWIAIGHAGNGPYRVTLTSVTDGGGTWILNWTPQFAQNLYEGESWTLYDPTTSPFNLGTTWTIEFWIKANNPSSAGINIPGGQWGLLNQHGWYYGIDSNSILIGLASGNLTIAQSSTADVQFAEPTAGIWTHVAIVNSSGTQKVFYNGIEQTKVSGSFGGNGWTNVTDDLYIGRLAPPYSSHFDGKITNVRMTNTAEYTGNFTPALLPGVVAGHTRLLWAPTDQAYFTDTGDSALTLTNNGVTIDTGDYPSLSTTHQSAVFGGDGGVRAYYSVPAGNYFNLGTTWTIEWWQKAAVSTASSGLLTVMSQNFSDSSIDIFYQSGQMYLGNGIGGGGLVAEPTPGIWTHVAVVSVAGIVSFYYNGSAIRTSTTLDYSPSDTANNLSIGRRASGDFQYFNGLMTNFRICGTAKYNTDFTPDLVPVLDAGHTVFLLNPTNRQVRDEGDNSLSITARKVVYSTDYPHELTGVVHPYNSGSLGNIYCLAGNPKLAAFEGIPLGAKITSNIAGFGTRTVTVRQSDGQGGWSITYNPTGLAGFTSDTDTFNFFW